jgi:hypothetical protein
MGQPCPNVAKAELADLGLLLPAYSPDMHRVIEHQTGITQAELHKATLRRDALHTPETLQVLVHATSAGWTRQPSPTRASVTSQVARPANPPAPAVNAAVITVP